MDRRAVNAKRAGRVQQIAHDGTPINAVAVDVQARVGWLLAMSRLHHRDERFADGRAFLAAMALDGVVASRSLLSRWESGEIPVSFEAMGAYERVLGLPEGQISSITAYVGMTSPRVTARLSRPRLDPSTTAFSERLDALIVRAEDGEASPAQWQHLAWHLAAVPLAHLRAQTWSTLARRLVGDLPRTVGLAYRQYSVAGFNLASVPRAQPFVVEAIADYVGDPEAQVLTTPVGLLDRLPTRAAARLVLDLVERPPTRAAFTTGVWLATEKLAKGDFTREERERLDMVVLKLWRRDPTRASEDLAELIAGMPEGVRSSLVTAATRAGRRRLGYAVEHGEEVPAARARSLAQAIADQARVRTPPPPAYAEDAMLTRLVREALFHRDSERRHLAGLVLASSPFARGLADCLLDLLTTGGQTPWTRIRLAVLVRYLAGDSHRLRLLSCVEEAEEAVVAALAQALGHLRFSPTSDQSLRAALGRERTLADRGRMYALGMSGSPALGLIAASGTAPSWQRTASRWWMASGPALGTGTPTNRVGGAGSAHAASRETQPGQGM